MLEAAARTLQLRGDMQHPWAFPRSEVRAAVMVLRPDCGMWLS